MMTRQRSRTVSKIFIVYDADGSRTGELLYILRKLLGIAHCAACDITHGPRTEKPEFTELKARGWNVPVLNIHRDEMDASLAESAGDHLPVVVARTHDEADIVLLGPQQLDECYGSVTTLEASINAALAGVHLYVPPFPPRAPQPKRSQVRLQPKAMGGAMADGDVFVDAPGDVGVELPTVTVPMDVEEAVEPAVNDPTMRVDAPTRLRRRSTRVSGEESSGPSASFAQSAAVGMVWKRSSDKLTALLRPQLVPDDGERGEGSEDSGDAVVPGL